MTVSAGNGSIDFFILENYTLSLHVDKLPERDITSTKIDKRSTYV